MECASRENYRVSNEKSNVIHQALAVKEVVGGDEHVPGKGTEPGKVVHPVHRIANGDDLLKAFHLYDQGLSRNKSNQIKSVAVKRVKHWAITTSISGRGPQ